MYPLIKTLHLLGVTLLTAHLLLYVGLWRTLHLPHSSPVIETLQSWMGRLFHGALAVVVITGFYLAFSAHFFSSPDDRWIYYKLGFALLFIGLVFRLKQRSGQPLVSFSKWGLWWTMMLVYVLLLYLSIAKPYLLNDLSMLWKPAPVVGGVVQPGEVEEVEEINPSPAYP